MSPVDPRTLKPGQRVRWTRTVEGIVRADHIADVEIQTADGDGHSIVVGRAGAVDTFEVLTPPLPRKPGTPIVARFTGPRGLTDPRIMRLTSQGEWVCPLTGMRANPEDITEWALLDGVHTVRDPEPEVPR